jgi:hypothetical protein
MSYGIIFWGKSTGSKKVFYIQKKIIRITADTKRRTSCRELFKKINILPLASKFFLSVLSFVMDNIEKFQTNSDIHNMNTRYRYNLHLPNTNLSKYKKGVYYSGIKLFNNLPPTIKSLNHDIKKVLASTERVSPISLLLLCRRIYLNQKFLAIINTCFAIVVMFSCVIIFAVIQ